MPSPGPTNPNATSSAALRLSDVHLTWPDGTPAFAGLDLLVPTGLNALVGDNGTGKSTLLRLLSGDLTPQQGSVTRPADLTMLRQDLTLQADLRVEEFLGIAAIRRALAAIAEGSMDPDNYDTVGADWDIEERTVATLARVGLPDDVLDRRLGELSGGEATRLGLAAVLGSRADVLLLDEPTNNLDADGRRLLAEALATRRGTTLVVTHDRALLDRVERIAELREGRVRWYPGPFTAYDEAVAAEQAAAEQAVRTASADLRRQQHDLADSQRVLAARKRFADKAYANKREPRVVMKLRKRSAQVSAGKYRALHEDRVEQARDRLTAAEARVRDDDPIRVDLAETEVPQGRVVLDTHDLVLRGGTPFELSLRGPERVALVGPNGAGKTTAVATLLGLLPAESGEVDLRVPARLLPQRLDLLDDELSVVDNVRALAPSATVQHVRARLARFGIRGSAGDRTAGGLSGGERFRATLAALLLAEPAPQLLVLDEPTNNLDRSSVERLQEALAAHRGALLVVSHDEHFLAEVGVTRTIELGQ